MKIEKLFDSDHFEWLPTVKLVDPKIIADVSRSEITANHFAKIFKADKNRNQRT
ncbi:MAG: hypothetical protein U0T83_08615 [Bacteriovoracaceae bacterium]